MKFHHINESEDDPFTDPNPKNLEEYLAKLLAQHRRANKVSFIGVCKLDQQLCDVTGETYAVDYCLSAASLRSGWTRYNSLQVSPKVMAAPTFNTIIRDIETQSLSFELLINIDRKISHVRNLIRTANASKKTL